jgi:hypothetical protein
VAMNLLTTKKKIALTGYPLQVQLDISNETCMLRRVFPVFNIRSLKGFVLLQNNIKVLLLLVAKRISVMSYGLHAHDELLS